MRKKYNKPELRKHDQLRNITFSRETGEERRTGEEDDPFDPMGRSKKDHERVNAPHW